MALFYNEEGEAKEFLDVRSAVANGYYLSEPPAQPATDVEIPVAAQADFVREVDGTYSVSYTHLRAHET